METYESIIDLLNQHGPGLQDYVTAGQLNQLIDGTLPLSKIADSYIADLAGSSVAKVTADPATTRAELLTWIRWEIEVAIEQRKQAAHDDAMASKLNELTALAAAEKRIAVSIHEDKMAVARQAMDRGATREVVAEMLGISRPTLNKWLNANR